MVDNNRSGMWHMLAAWCSTAFLVAGGLFVVFALIWGVYAFTEMTPELVQDVVGPAGWVAAFAGLLGLYPKLADRTPRLAQIGAIFAAIGIIGGALTFAVNLVQLTGTVDELPPWFDLFNLPIIVGIFLGFTAFASATLRTDAYSDTIGFLLLAPAIIFALNFVRVLVLGSTTPIWAPFVLGSAQALALLTTGYVLSSTASPTPANARLH